MIENDICWCGHKKQVHIIDYDFCCEEHSSTDWPLCLGCRENDELDFGADHFFKQDNLAYLEYLHKLRQKDI